MNEHYTNIKFESDKKVSPSTVTRIITVSEDEPALIENLLSTKNYTDVFVKRQGNNLTVVATGNRCKPGFEIYPSKYSFVGLRFVFPFMNVTERLDNLSINVGTDLPAYDFNDPFMSFMKANLFYKQSLKLSYTINLWSSGSILKVDVGKTAKADGKHVGFNMTALNLLSVWGRKIDMQLKNRITRNRYSEIDYDTMIKLRFNASDLNYETLPMGGRLQLKLIHSVLTTSLYKVKAEINAKRYFYSSWLPSYSNLELSLRGLATNDDGQNVGNIRGFNLLDKSLERNRVVASASLKYNYFDIKALIDRDANPFIFVTGKANESAKVDWEVGFGFQKIFKKHGSLEVMYNYRQQNIQMRFEPL